MRISVAEKEKIMRRIIDTAEQLISEGGLSAFNLRALSNAADVKMGSVYNHFSGGLDEVILLVNSRTIKMLDAVLAKVASESEGQALAVLFQRMAVAYLHFSIDYDRRFAALFEHRMSNDAPIPEWHLQEHYALFRHVELPLSTLGLGLSEDDRRVFARTIYSAVHGIVHLGRQGRLIALPVPVIEQQLSMITAVLASGLGTLVSTPASPIEA